MKEKQKWKPICFGQILLMILHGFFCIMSDRRWQWILSENKYNADSIIIMYSIPILIIFAITFAMCLIHAANTLRILSAIKLVISLISAFWIWLIMLMAYHNPTTSEWTFINITTLFMSLAAICFFVFEIMAMKCTAATK